MNEDQKIIDPLALTQDQMPVIVLCDDLRGFLGWIIKAHTSGNYCHAMIMRQPGQTVTQNNVLKEIPILGYMKPAEMLKFWRIKNLTADEAKIIFDAIAKDLAKPWWKRMYDLVGLIGQAVWMPFIQTPGLNYCSENVAKYMRMIPRFKAWLPAEVNPSKMDAVFKSHSEDMELVGYWFQI